MTLLLILCKIEAEMLLVMWWVFELLKRLAGIVHYIVICEMGHKGLILGLKPEHLLQPVADAGEIHMVIRSPCPARSF